jgi:sirohydrochlorin cobaltochelatase
VSPPPYDATVLLSCGHESVGGTALPELTRPAEVLPVGRALSEAVSTALERASRPVCVVPMTLGRDPRLVAESARALRWVGAESGHPHRVALTASFGTTDHLTAWLRSAALRFERVPDAVCGLLIAAPAGGPFDDAELFRIARLVRQYGRHRLVEVAFTAGDPDIAEGIERLTRLGAQRVGLISAGFGPVSSETLNASVPVDDAGPLLGSAMICQVVQARVVAALEGLARGEDGIAAGLHAEHGHGYAHSHPPAIHTHPHTEHPHTDHR